MVKPLSFKGDKKRKKRVRDPDEPQDDRRPKSSAQDKAIANDIRTEQVPHEEDQSWVSAEAVSEISGPVLIVLPSETPTSISCDPLGKVFPIEVEMETEGDPSTAEPHDVRQVWVANRVAGTESFSLKGHHGKYLACDKFGVLSAVREAVGPEESWTVVPVADSTAMFALQTPREKFLTTQDGKLASEISLRGDGESIGFDSTVRIRMQRRFKPRRKANKDDGPLQKITRKEIEDAVGRRLEDDEVKFLKRAHRDGNYHEALLDVKVKGKHDKFA